MHSEKFEEWAFLTPEKLIEFDAVAAQHSATNEPDYKNWGNLTLKGEQPEDSAVPNPGALRGDYPLSSLEKEIK